MYELHIVWIDGSKNSHTYDTKEEAVFEIESARKELANYIRGLMSEY